MDSKIKKIKTSDGSYTFYNSEFDQCYHTKSGALEEALKKHLEPSGIIDKVHDLNKIVIADMFFGLAYNSIVAVSKIWEKNPDCVVEVLAFENDYSIMRELKNIDLPDEYLAVRDLFVELIDSKPSSKSTDIFKLHTLNKGNLKVLLFVGDARKSIKTISPNILDAVFFDPFSPSRVPELWSKELFLSIWRKMKKGGVLTTYSCARLTRDNLRKANFIVTDGPIIGRRSPSTVAHKE